MLAARVIPCLLLDGKSLVKTVRFQDPTYVGDPINAVKIFNDSFVDEILFFDRSASRDGRPPNFHHIEEIAGECFIPFCYGGGVTCLKDAEKLFTLGVEKVSINTAALSNPQFITALSRNFGSQSVVVTMDVHRGFLGQPVVMSHAGSRRTGITPVEYAKKAQDLGAGELLVNSVDRDGTLKGYDIELMRSVNEAVSVPVIACGGAGSLLNIAEVVRRADVSAAAAGSLFVFNGKLRAVLISYPSQRELRDLLGTKGATNESFENR